MYHYTNLTNLLKCLLYSSCTCRWTPKPTRGSWRAYSLMLACWSGPWWLLSWHSRGLALPTCSWSAFSLLYSDVVCCGNGWLRFKKVQSRLNFRPGISCRPRRRQWSLWPPLPLALVPLQKFHLNKQTNKRTQKSDDIQPFLFWQVHGCCQCSWRTSASPSFQWVCGCTSCY